MKNTADKSNAASKWGWLRRRATAGALAFTLLVTAGALAFSSCASSPESLTREQQLYQAGTNLVASVQSAVPYLPVPVSSAAEVVLGLASAALAAWNTHQQLAIRKLKNGGSNGKSPPSPPPVPAPAPTGA